MALLVCLKEEIAKKWLQMKKKNKCSFTKTMHHVTSWSQRWQNYMNYSLNCFRAHPILQIWPPSDYWLFADLKRRLQGKGFSSNKEVILEIDIYFEAKDKLF